MIKLILSVVVFSNIAMANTQPEGLVFSCWDGSFAYGEFQVIDKGSNYELSLAHSQLEVFSDLEPAVGKEWSRGVLTITTPKESCRIIKEQTLISCHFYENEIAQKTSAEIRIREFDQDDRVYSIDMKNKSLQIVKTISINDFHEGETIANFALSIFSPGVIKGKNSHLDISFGTHWDDGAQKRCAPGMNFQF